MTRVVCFRPGTTTVQLSSTEFTYPPGAGAIRVVSLRPSTTVDDRSSSYLEGSWESRGKVGRERTQQLAAQGIRRVIRGTSAPKPPIEAQQLAAKVLGAVVSLVRGGVSVREGSGVGVAARRR